VFGGLTACSGTNGAPTKYTTYAWCGDCDVKFDVHIPDMQSGTIEKAGSGRYLYNTDKQLFRFDNFPTGGKGNTTQILNCSMASLESPMCETYVVDFDAGVCQSSQMPYIIPVLDLPTEALRSDEKSSATVDFYSAAYATGPFSRVDWVVDVMTGKPLQSRMYGSMPFPPAYFLAGYQEFTQFDQGPVDDAMFNPKKVQGAPPCQPGSGEMLKRDMKKISNVYAQYQSSESEL